MFKAIYISDEDIETWDKMVEEAKKEKRGIGYYIVRLYRNKKNDI